MGKLLPEQVSDKLGCRVKDIITKPPFEGIVTSVTFCRFGCKRLGVAPIALDNNKPQEEVYSDDFRFEVVEKQIPHRVVSIDDFKIKLGQKLKDKESPFHGYVSALTYHLSGSKRIAITSTELTDKGHPAERWFDEAQFLLDTPDENPRPTEGPCSQRPSQPQPKYR